MPTPEQVVLVWTTDVIEHYRTTVNTVDLPQSVQDALAAGNTIIDIDRAADESLYTAKDELADFISDHEEGPYDEEVTDRDLDYDRVIQQNGYEKGPSA